ncbi:MAG: hypothetical protein ACLUFN_03300 [Eubacterium sp.]
MNKKVFETTLKYIKAFANLYGIISIKEAQAMLNKYENKSYSIVNVLEDESMSTTDRYGFIILEDDNGYMIVANDAFYVSENNLEELMQAQEGKRYAKLPKDELLKYEDRDYFQRTPQFRNMITFLMYALKLPNSKATEIAENIAYMCIAGMSPDQVFSLLEEDDVVFADMQQYNQFLMRYSDMANNTRLWENRGHTPNELRRNMK